MIYCISVLDSYLAVSFMFSVPFKPQADAFRARPLVAGVTQDRRSTMKRLRVVVNSPDCTANFCIEYLCPSHFSAFLKKGGSVEGPKRTSCLPIAFALKLILLKAMVLRTCLCSRLAPTGPKCLHNVKMAFRESTLCRSRTAYV